MFYFFVICGRKIWENFLILGKKNKTSVAVFLDNIRFLLDILKIGSERKVFGEDITVPKVLILLEIFRFWA